MAEKFGISYGMSGAEYMGEEALCKEMKKGISEILKKMKLFALTKKGE